MQRSRAPRRVPTPLLDKAAAAARPFAQSVDARAARGGRTQSRRRRHTARRASSRPRAVTDALSHARMQPTAPDTYRTQSSSPDAEPAPLIEPPAVAPALGRRQHRVGRRGRRRREGRARRARAASRVRGPAAQRGRAPRPVHPGRHARRRLRAVLRDRPDEAQAPQGGALGAPSSSSLFALEASSSLPLRFPPPSSSLQIKPYIQSSCRRHVEAGASARRAGAAAGRRCSREEERERERKTELCSAHSPGRSESMTDCSVQRKDSVWLGVRAS